MRTSILSLVATMIVSLFTTTAEARPHHRTEQLLPCAREDRQVGERRVLTIQGRTYEQLTDEAALAHLENLKLRKKEAFTKAIALVAARGYKPTDQVFVARALAPTSLNESVRSSDFSDSSEYGELTVWSWDDGYDGTWEGIMYAERYSDGQNKTYEAQVDIEEGAETIYSVLVHHDGGPYDQLATAAAPLDVGSLLDEQEYYWCAFKGCLAAAIACKLTGPGWPVCFFAGCTYALVDCFLDQAWP